MRPAERIDEAIGARIRAFRLQRKLSQTDLGETLGVTFQQIQKYAKGTNRVSGSRLVALCELLNVARTDPGQRTRRFSYRPDVFEALMADRDMVRMFLELTKLPTSQRKSVTSAIR